MLYKGRKTSFDFLGWAKVLTPFSIAISFGALIYVFLYGFTYGVDFAGGNEIHAQFPKNTNAVQIREVLKKAGISNPLVQSIDSGPVDKKEASSSKPKAADKNVTGLSKEFLIRVEVMESEEETIKNYSPLERLWGKVFKDFLFLEWIPLARRLEKN